MAKKGNVPWNKGIKGTHFSPTTEFKKGFKHTKAWKQKMSGIIKKLGNKPPVMKGEKNVNWKGGKIMG